MSLKDINLDKTGNLIIIDDGITTETYSEDNVFWELRNLLIKLFAKKTNFWNLFKGGLIKDKHILEETIKKEMFKEINKYYPAEPNVIYLKIEILILNSVAHIFPFKIEPFLVKDKLLIDFKINL